MEVAEQWQVDRYHPPLIKAIMRKHFYSIKINPSKCPTGLSADMKSPMGAILWWSEGAALVHIACPCTSTQNGSGLDQGQRLFPRLFFPQHIVGVL